MMTHAKEAAYTERPKDPVCGMDVLPQSAADTVSHAGQTYYFCSRGCASKFKSDPHKYVESKPELQHSLAASDVRTCPMHPEVRQKGPGNCPTCGMALEPAMPAAPLTRTEYTCPMHPEIVRDEPGTCPICGMALEPR